MNKQSAREFFSYIMSNAFEIRSYLETWKQDDERNVGRSKVDITLLDYVFKLIEKRQLSALDLYLFFTLGFYFHLSERNDYYIISLVLH